MLWLSELLIQGHDLDSFAALTEAVKARASDGEVFFRMDVRPPFPDTPEDWEDRLEAAFSTAQKR
ncbi:MAG: sulfur relay protein DsrC [Gammaproteobacteria bacterium]